jgi:small subunit ribosomal protein S19e
VTKNYLGKYIIEIRDLLNFQCYFRSGKVKLPEWVDVVKTNIAKELAPYDEDWYYIRLASMARHIYVRSPVGVQTVCKIYGVRRNMGSAPSHWRAGSGTIARKGLQTLEQLKLVEKDPNGGRRMSPQGRRDLDRIAAQIVAVGKVKPAPVAAVATA